MSALAKEQECVCHLAQSTFSETAAAARVVGGGAIMLQPHVPTDFQRNIFQQRAYVLLEKPQVRLACQIAVKKHRPYDAVTQNAAPHVHPPIDLLTARRVRSNYDFRNLNDPQKLFSFYSQQTLPIMVPENAMSASNADLNLTSNGSCGG